jgi:hypothetical protein
MPRILSEMDSVGLRPIGYTVQRQSGPKELLNVVPLARQGIVLAQVISVRLSMSTDNCATLQSAGPGELPDLLEESLELADLGDVPTALLLHRADDSISDESMATLMDALDSLPGELLVSVYHRSSAGPLLTGKNGPRMQDMGAGVHDDSLFPSAVMPHGWLVQCFKPTPRSMTCVPRLVAGYFGDALPVAGGKCNACAFLPSSLDEVLRYP